MAMPDLTPDQASTALMVEASVLLGPLAPEAVGALRTTVSIRNATKQEQPKAESPKGTAGGERAGKDFTRAGKAEVKGDNASKNGGQTKCENCGQPTVPAQQSRSGVTPPKNETHVDHIIPKSKGGDGSPSNGQVLCRECNLNKSDKL